MIRNININDIYNKPDFNTTSSENKQLYGEVKTPFSFVENILKIIPIEIYKNPYLKWLDPGSGTGNFSIILYYNLMKYLEPIIVDNNLRHDHIIKNMIYMVEVIPDNVKILKRIFGEEANIYEGNFLEYHPGMLFDVVIGNPPFNCNGLKKVPTNNQGKKTQDGKTIWINFVVESILHLKNKTGLMCIFIPSIWMKPDKEKMYDFLTRFQIEKMNCITNTETNRIFHGEAQTPSCYFLLTKKPSNNIINIYDNGLNKYIDYDFVKGKPIPVFGQQIVKKLQKYCIINGKNNTISVIKTNLPSKNVDISDNMTDLLKYSNITTCRLKDSIIPELIINYSNKPLVFQDIPKLVLAHKMYGFPYLDLSGQYGISNRDNYIITNSDPKKLLILQKFLSTKTALYLFESTRYRMKYLEKYAFELIPDITNLNDFPEIINDKTISDYFNFNEEERKTILDLHKKDYSSFI